MAFLSRPGSILKGTKHGLDSLLVACFRRNNVRRSQKPVPTFSQHALGPTWLNCPVKTRDSGVSEGDIHVEIRDCPLHFRCRLDTLRLLDHANDRGRSDPDALFQSYAIKPAGRTAVVGLLTGASLSDDPAIRLDACVVYLTAGCERRGIL
ncbi:MAG: hypothetical protein JF571_05325 [Asticcacaulis sp.]|nr:hypothetical protein [Asticcacaulis sp.]